jgi:hypothetical protein
MKPPTAGSGVANQPINQRISRMTMIVSSMTKLLELSDWDQVFPALGFLHNPALRATKKADVVEHPRVPYHVGLPVDGPPGSAKVPFI